MCRCVSMVRICPRGRFPWRKKCLSMLCKICDLFCWCTFSHFHSDRLKIYVYWLLKALETKKTRENLQNLTPRQFWSSMDTSPTILPPYVQKCGHFDTSGSPVALFVARIKPEIQKKVPNPKITSLLENLKSPQKFGRLDTSKILVAPFVAEIC